MRRQLLGSLIAAACCAAPAFGVLSANVIGGGAFEAAGFDGVDTVGENLESIIKINDSPRTAPEVSANLSPVRAWQFHPGGIAAEGPTIGQPFTDLGKWVGTWGIGITPDVRNPLLSPSPAHNRSIVTRNGQRTGIMEGTAFRMGVAQIIAAPANMIAGPAKLDFDYFFRYWQGNPSAGVYNADLGSTAQILRLEVWGVDDGELPVYADRFWPTDNDAELTPLGWTKLYDAPNFNNFRHNDWLLGNPIAEPFVPGLPTDTPDDQVWKTLSDGVWQYADNDATPDIYDDGSFNVAQTYKYFYVYAFLTTYSEPNPYFWLLGNLPADTMSVAIDNVSLQTSILFPAGDMNLDLVVNVQDINPFVVALGGTAAYKAYLATRLTALGIDPSQVDGVYAQVDPNQSGAINVQDINPFVVMLAGAGVDTGNLIIPEPASLSLLALGGLALARRRG